ncbi:class I SAM-dependent methyltransferase [Marinicrinis sediminis]|uniref:Class I SAM-dependent methyltransferase n=1 Tax=Marinicrinis sediminis TaxID=1652465 RepID=A0ABW5R714_9BACL
MANQEKDMANQETEKAWYEESFGEDYLLVYKHRDVSGAYEEVKKMVNWLELPEGAAILDLCCGMGRHSLALNEFGYDVTGVDLSETLLREAKKADGKQSVEWLQGDMRDVPLDQKFDAVVNLFTSFGYFEQDQENARVLHEIERLLAPGGKFIIDFLNPQYVKDHLVPYSEKENEGIRIEENRRISSDGRFVQKTITVNPEHHPRQYEERVRLYTQADFQALLENTSLQISHVYGGYNQESYDPARSPRMILVGAKIGKERKQEEYGKQGVSPS